MSEPAAAGIVYTEFRRLKADTPLLSLWTHRSSTRERGRRRVQATADGRDEYWLDRGDPLLNTILPGTAVSLVVNLGDPWATGSTASTPEPVPAVCVMGPFTQAQALHLGNHVRVLGAVLPAIFAPTAFGCRAGDLVNRILPLEDLWPRWRIARLVQALGGQDDAINVEAVRRELLDAASTMPDDTVVTRAARILSAGGGRMPIHDLASAHGVSHQTLARRFGTSTGLPPKHFARICRFQALVHLLLVTDVEQWGVTAPRLGFYDQAHMINEFRTFAGQSPTTFFQSRGQDVPSQKSGLHGRPCEWGRPAVSKDA
jgi:AraC-like DNA-binding protein